jgi:hypothetical protein
MLVYTVLYGGGWRANHYEGGTSFSVFGLIKEVAKLQKKTLQTRLWHKNVKAL